MTTLQLQKETREVVAEAKAPDWMKLLFSILITALLTGLLTTWANSSGQDAKIDNHSESIKALYQTKANKEDVSSQINLIEKRLDKIEDKQDITNEKLDKLIGKVEKTK